MLGQKHVQFNTKSSSKSKTQYLMETKKFKKENIQYCTLKINKYIYQNQNKSNLQLYLLSISEILLLPNLFCICIVINSIQVYPFKLKDKGKCRYCKYF